MSGEAIRLKVLNIAHYRKAPFKQRGNSDLDQPRYTCCCDSDSFKLMSNGAIYCASCGCKISNLRLMDVG